MAALDVLRQIWQVDAESGMTDRDRVLLSPVEKWKLFGRFPFKFLFHVVLLALVLVEVYVIVAQFTTYYSAKNQIFFHYFLPDADPEDTVFRLYSVQDVLDFIEQTVTNYAHLDNSSIGNFNLDTDHDGIVDPLILAVYKFGNLSGPHHDSLRVLEPQYYNLTIEHPLGPFEDMEHDEARQELVSTSLLSVTFSFDNHASTQFVSSAKFRWSLTVALQNNDGVVEATLRSQRVGIDPMVIKALSWIPGSVIVVSTISLILGIKALVAAGSVYRRTKRRWNSIPVERLLDSYKRLELHMVPITNWSDIGLTIKFDFFGTWYGIEIIGDALFIIANIMGLFEDQSGLPISDLSRVLLGIGIIVMSMNMTKYFEYWKKFYTLVLTLQGAFKRNIRFVVSVMPLFMGFAVCGMIAFSPYSSRFESLDATAISLFALINGDDVHATFLDVGPRFPYPAFAGIYLFIFCLLFISAILNIFIFIIEDSYNAAKDFITNEADRHSRLFRATGGDTAGFDLPTLFDILDDVANNLPQERLIRLKEQRLKAMTSSGMAIPASVALTPGRPGSITASLSQSFLLQHGINTDRQDLTPTKTSSRERVESSDEEDIISMQPPQRSAPHSDSWPMAPRRTPSIQEPTPEDAALNQIIANAQKEFLNDVEQRVKAAQAEFSRKLTRDLRRHFSSSDPK